MGTQITSDQSKHRYGSLRHCTLTNEIIGDYNIFPACPKEGVFRFIVCKSLSGNTHHHHRSSLDSLVGIKTQNRKQKLCSRSPGEMLTKITTFEIKLNLLKSQSWVASLKKYYQGSLCWCWWEWREFAVGVARRAVAAVHGAEWTVSTRWVKRWYSNVLCVVFTDSNY